MENEETNNAGVAEPETFKTPAEVNEYIERKMAQEMAKSNRGGGDNRPSPLADNNGMVVKDADSIAVGDDVTPPWVRRDVKLLNAQACRRQPELQERHIQGMEEVRTGRKQATATEKAAEEKAAREIITQSGLTPMQVRRTLSTLSAGAGSVLLSKPFLAEVLVIREKYGVARRLARWFRMTSKELDLKSIATKMVWAFVDQLGKIPVTDLVFAADQKLTTEKGGGITTWSREMNEDEAIELLPVVTEDIGEGWAKWEDQLCFVADGTSNYKSMTGILHAAANVVTMAAGKTSYTDINADHLRALRDAVPTSAQDGAVYGMHRTLWSHIEGLKATGDGQYIVRQPSDATQGRPTLWGFPVEIIEVMPTAADDDPATKFVWFGNPQRAFMGVARDFEFSMHDSGVLQDSNGDIIFNSVQQDAELLRFTAREGVKIPTPNTQRFAALATAAS